MTAITPETLLLIEDADTPTTLQVGDAWIVCGVRFVVESVGALLVRLRPLGQRLDLDPRFNNEVKAVEDD